MLKEKFLSIRQFLLPIVIWLSAGLVVYCSILLANLAPQIRAHLNSNKILRDNPYWIAYTSSLVAMWWLAFHYMIFHSTKGYRWRNVLHAFQWLPVVLCVVCWYACGISWQTLFPYAMCVAVFAFICEPSLMPAYKQQDIPFKPDVLGRRLLYEQLSHDIRRRMKQEQTRGITMAVTGTWGEGKSHLIHYVVHELLHEQVEECATEPWQRAFKYASVDVWQCDTVEAMWNEISESLASAIKERDVRLRKRWGRILVALLRSLHIPHDGLAEDIFRVLTTGVGGAGSVTETLSRQIQLQGQPYVLILDNLDRCGADKLQELFPLIERLKSIPYLVTICGISYREMAEVDDKIAKVLDDTFLKIFEMVIPIPQVAEEYRVPFMLYLAQKAGGSERLQAWCSTSKLPLHSPRIIENIMSRLAFIDSHFLGWMEFNSDLNDVMKNVGASLSIVDAVFFLETLRVVTPSLVVHMEKMKNPKEALDELVKWSESLKEGNEQKEVGKVVYPAIWKSFEQKIFQSPLVSQLMNILARADKKVLEFALKQYYLAGRVLSDVECEECFEHFKKSENKIEFLKGYAEKKRILAYEKAAMYISLMRYAVQHSDVHYTPDLAATCQNVMESNEMQNSGMPLHHYGWAFQLLDAYFSVQEKQTATSVKWHELAEAQLNQLDINLHQKLAATLLDYRNNQYAVELIPDAPRVSEAVFRARERKDARFPIDDIFHMVMKSYGRKIAEGVVRGVKQDTQKQCWIVGQSVPARQYVVYMKNGVEEYICKTLSVDLQDEDASHTIRQNLLATLRIGMWNENYTEIIQMPFIVLSFVVVWMTLCRAVFGDGNLSLSERDEVLGVLEELKQDLRKKIKSSDDFIKNRKSAIRILISSLEKLVRIEKS